MDFEAARNIMIQGQILPNKVSDPRVLNVMQKLPREVFFPESKKSLAYADTSIAIGDGRYAMEPRALARLVQSAKVMDTDIVLSIGCGLGYSVAILAQLGSTVFAVESNKAFADQASRTFDTLGINNVVIIPNDPTAGYIDQAPYNVIFFDGAVPEIPRPISQQLGDGGRLVAIVRKGKLGKASIMTKYMGICSERAMFDASVPLLYNFETDAEFIF